MKQPAPVESWKLVAIGLAAGVIGGGLGVGGGIILVPLLLAVGLGRHRAHATSLSAIILISTTGVISFGLAGEIAVGLGVAIGVGGVVGSIVGASVMHRLSPRFLSVVFGLVLFVAGVRLIMSSDPLAGSGDLSGAAQLGLALVIGLLAGFFAGLAGIGGGVVIVPSSVFFLGLDQHAAQGTSLLAIVFTAVAGTVVNVRNGHVRPVEGLIVGAGGVVGSLIGTQIALLIEGRTLSLIFGCLVLLIALRTLGGAWRSRTVSAS